MYIIRLRQYISSINSTPSYLLFNGTNSTPSSIYSSFTQGSTLISFYRSVSVLSIQGLEEQLRIKGIQVGQVRPTSLATRKHSRSVSIKGSVGKPPNSPRAA